MSHDAYYEVWYSFRIVGLPEQQSSLLKKTFPQYAWEAGQYYSDKSLAVLHFNLTEKENYAPLIQFMHDGAVNPVSYGLFVALSSDRSDTGIEFPRYVLDFYRAMGGTIDVSIVAGISGSSEQENQAKA
jgi:hypothetical protein